MRIDTESKQVILDPWEGFKEYCKTRFDAIFFRHLYYNRTPEFLEKAADYASEELEKSQILDNTMMSERPETVYSATQKNTLNKLQAMSADALGDPGKSSFTQAAFAGSDKLEIDETELGRSA